MIRRYPAAGKKPLSDFARNRSAKSGFGSYCKPSHNSVVAANRKKNHGGSRTFWLNRRYRVDGVQVAWMVLRQGGVCALCASGKPEHVDHDHRTRRVRGILCFNCNRGLGKFGDDVGLMSRAAEYLESVLSR